MAPDGSYLNLSGCGNSLNSDHPVVRQFILDTLRYWATEYEIDGFRLDLSALSDPDPEPEQQPGEGGEGAPAPQAGAPRRPPRQGPPPGPPLIELIAADEVLRTRKVITEGLSGTARRTLEGQRGFSPQWTERNVSFRNAVRNFVKGTDGAGGRTHP